MPFALPQVVPWGRSYEEYVRMFSLTRDDLQRSIIGFGDGPTSFNAVMHRNGARAVSCDPLYRFSKGEIAQRTEETWDEVLAQTRANMHNFVWRDIATVEALATVRGGAMAVFLEDYEAGKAAGRYLPHELPAVPLADRSFELGLSAHFLFLYSKRGLDFHIGALAEMLRLCAAVRIFPLVDLDARKSELLGPVTGWLAGRGYTRQNMLFRRVIAAGSGEVVGEEFIASNRAVMMYEPLLAARQEMAGGAGI